MFRGIRLAAVSAALVSLLLTGCSAPATAPAPAATSAPTPTASATPAFASKEEAFAAAEKVYRRYLSISRRELSDPAGADISAYEQVLTGDALSSQTSVIDQAQKKAVRLEGAQVLRLFQGQSFNSREGTVSAYACVDFSRARVVNTKGVDVTPASRAVTGSSVVRFRWTGSGLLLERETEYQGQPLC